MDCRLQAWLHPGLRGCCQNSSSSTFTSAFLWVGFKVTLFTRWILYSYISMFSFKTGTECGPLLVFINQVLLKHSHTHLFTYCLWPLFHYDSRAEWLQQRKSGPQNLKYLPAGSLQKALINPWSKRKFPTFSMCRYKVSRVTAWVMVLSLHQSLWPRM